MTREERDKLVSIAKGLRKSGMSIARIAEVMGIVMDDKVWAYEPSEDEEEVCVDIDRYIREMEMDSKIARQEE